MATINIPTMEQLEELIQLNDKRVVVLGSVAGFVVPPMSGEIAIPSLSLSNYPIQFVASRVGNAHDYVIDFAYTASGIPTTFGAAIMPAVKAYESNGQVRGGSEWIEAKSASMYVYVRNNSEMEQAYDVILYGVR